MGRPSFFPVLPGMGQASPDPFPQYVPLESCENGEHLRQGATGRRGQIQSFSQGDETDAEVLQFLEGCQQVCDRPAPTVQPPDQDNVDFPPPGGVHHLLAKAPLGRSGTDLLNLQGYRPTPPGGVFP